MDFYDYPDDYPVEEDKPYPKLSRFGGMAVDVCQRCQRCKQGAFYYAQDLSSLKKKLTSIQSCIEACEKCNSGDPDLEDLDREEVQTKKDINKIKKGNRTYGEDFIPPTEEEEKSGFHVKLPSQTN